MAFRPCIDLQNGRVVQIVGGTLTDAGASTINHVSAHPASYFAELYARDNLRGGHVVMLGQGNEAEALSALRAYPGGLQIGGGITPENAASYLEAGASHVIVTSYLFEGKCLSWERLRAMQDSVGKGRLVVDLSCRRTPTGYFVATNKWQTVTQEQVNEAFIRAIEPFCDELLIHAADVEGRQAGMDAELVSALGQWVNVPTTYAGGARKLADIARVEELSQGKVDLTIGSALDIFGGTRVRYADAARLGRRG